MLSDQLPRSRADRVQSVIDTGFEIEQNGLRIELAEQRVLRFDEGIVQRRSHGATTVHSRRTARLPGRRTCMGGIFGVWNRDGQPLEAALTARLGQTLSHRTRVQCLSIPPMPDAPAIAFDGRLDNRDELLDGLGASAALNRDSADSVIALAAYRAYGDGFVARLDGDFALAIFDPSRR